MRRAFAVCATVLSILLVHRGGAASDDMTGFDANGRPRPITFIRLVLGDTELVWHAVFKQKGMTYEEPKLVLYTGHTQTACGEGRAISGPFYCPVDRRIYLDLSFMRELAERHGAPGEFAFAYVIAHEVAHHVQYLLGIHGRVDALTARLEQTAANQLLVRQELQADCLAGVWGHHINLIAQRLEPGEAEAGFAAAAALGNDRLQAIAGQSVMPETFTHGSSTQRMRWLRRGLESGRIADCDTFSIPAP